FGVALLVAAARARGVREPELHPTEPRGTGPRTKALLNRLMGLRPVEASGAGALLGMGGPKRLVISVLAAATISTSGLHSQGKLVFSAFYVVIATVLVWAPVLLYVIAGERAGEWMVRGREWLTSYRQPLTFWLLVVFGLFFVVDGVVRLS
ncbi:MAG: GAP family protein, partial [Acidimicrobiia bacterium]